MMRRTYLNGGRVAFLVRNRHSDGHASSPSCASGDAGAGAAVCVCM